MHGNTSHIKQDAINNIWQWRISRKRSINLQWII